jgi:hypothetical protein
MRVAKYANDETAIIYDIDIRQILELLRDSELPNM